VVEEGKIIGIISYEEMLQDWIRLQITKNDMKLDDVLTK
jgi:hypothetical protein